MGIIIRLKSILNLYRRFRKNQEKFKNSNIRYYDFWALSRSEDCWFTQFIEHRNINANHKKINFFSVYGDPKTSLFAGSPKIFFTGENIFTPTFPAHYRYQKSYLKNYNLSLGFNYLAHDKYLRFPLWILYIIPPDADFATIKNLIDSYNNPQHRKSEARWQFCANISRHDAGGIRKKLIELLSPIQTVSCPGSFLKNTDELQDKYNDDKIAYLKTFKFNICPENSDDNGYVTEKLLEAIVSGSIPIYWGSNNKPEPAIINPEAVLFFDPENPQNLYNKVRLLWEDKAAFEEFCSIKPFTEDAAEVIWEWLNALQSKIEDLI